MKRAKIIVSDDIMTLDESEVTFNQKKQLDEIVSSFMRCTQDAEVAEVYDLDTDKMIARYILTRKGKVVPTDVEHFNWGGARARSGRPSLGDKALRNKAFFNVSDEMYKFLDTMPRRMKSTWLRQAVEEKRERENNKNNENTLDK